MPVNFRDASDISMPATGRDGFIAPLTSWIVLFLIILTSDGGAAQLRLNPQKLSLPAIDGKAINPFQTTNKAVAFVFISAECPISNRYAPEVQRLHEKFSARDVAFWLVYPNTGESDQTIGQHLKDFRHTAHALRDPKHELVRLARVRVTPEAAIFRPGGELLYHGRIDDRNVDFGKERPEPTVRDFEAALEAVMNGQTPKAAGGRAVGCPIQ